MTSMTFEPLGGTTARLVFDGEETVVIDLRPLLLAEPDGRLVADNEELFKTGCVLEGGTLAWMLDTPSEVIIPAPIIWEAVAQR